MKDKKRLNEIQCWFFLSHSLNPNLSKPLLLKNIMQLISPLLSSPLCHHFYCLSETDSQAGAAGLGPGGGLDSSQPHFSSSLPTYFPVQCQLSGADSVFFLREANQDVMRNGSLSSRVEPLFLHKLELGISAPHSLPSINCSYGNLSVEQPIPVDLLQGPPPHLLPGSNFVTLNWKVKGQVVVPKVGSSRPWIQVRTFHFLLKFSPQILY